MHPAKIWICAVIILAILPATPARAAGPDQARVHLGANLQAGQSFRYQLNLQSSVTSVAEGPISDPQGATRLDRVALAVIRMEVLRVDPLAADQKRVRLRVTFEQCSSSSRADALDIEDHEFQDKFRKLQGTSIEFDLEPDGKTDHFQASQNGPDKQSPRQSPQQALEPAIQSLLQQGTTSLSAPSGLPRQGIAIGDTWSADRSFESAPLSGLYWHSDSTYVRSEPCPHPSPSAASGAPKDSTSGNATAPKSSAGPDICAVIQTDLQLLEHTYPEGQTPPAYIQNGLRTSGKWTGTAESVSDISLSTGLAVTVTQTGSQDMDFRITSAQNQSSVQYKGHVESALGVTLLP